MSAATDARETRRDRQRRERFAGRVRATAEKALTPDVADAFRSLWITEARLLWPENETERDRAIEYVEDVAAEHEARHE